MSRSGLRMLVLGGIILLVSVLSAHGQFGYQASRFEMLPEHLMVDYAYFLGDDPSRVRLEIYYQIHNRGLAFDLERGQYTASYELVVVVEDDGEEVVETFTRDRQVIIPVNDEARTRIDFRTSQINLEVEPGKYKARFKLRDRSSGRIVNKELKIKLDGLGDDGPRMSAVEFAQAFERRPDSTSVFAKSDLLIVPSVHRIYGSLEDDRVAFYFEVYPGTKDSEKVVIETKIRHYRKGMLYRDTLHVTLGDQPERQLREISLARFLPGIYELDVAVKGRRDKQLAHRSEEFRVAWTQDGMILNDWKATVMQLDLFSEDVDVGDMEKLESYEERLQAFEQFWTERDPTDGTPENEVKAAFYYRIRVADERFGVMRMDGWRTDRGRVFVRYGEPDYMVEEPFALDRQPYQIWHFTSISPRRTFVFIDENEDGDYRLQYPYDGLGYTGDY